MAWSTFYCHISKLMPRHFVIMLAVIVVGSYGQIQHTAVPSTSLKITISTFCKQIYIFVTVYVVSEILI